MGKPPNKNAPQSDPTKCHVHNHMRKKKPQLEDKPPLRTCILCTRVYCDDHKGAQDGVCETNHAKHYETHRELQHRIYESVEDWETRTGGRIKSDEKDDLKDTTTQDCSD